jgi:hypothetical protein
MGAVMLRDGSVLGVTIFTADTPRAPQWEKR